jgi:hypothetical protein
MRGWTAGGDEQRLYANTSGVEAATSNYESLTATGFASLGSSYVAGAAFIYIAIRRGPMKTPTVGTSVYNAISRTGTGAVANITGVGFPPDFIMARRPATPGDDNNIWDRLRGATKSMYTQGIGGESTNANTVTAFGMDGVSVRTSQPNAASDNYINWFFRRGPSVFDIVCYTGTGSNTTFTHNLGVVPELIIVKRRDSTGAWDSYCSALANTEYVVLNTTAAKATGATRWNSTTPTSSVFSVGTSTTTNASAGTYVAYLFATCAGVSKVGSYTGTATTLQIDCGFTGGARFVLIKRTDSTGDWYVWDTARGIVSGNDPYLLLNSTAAEVTNTDYIDTYSAGFEISSTASIEINESGGTYIFLAIA